MKSKSGRPFFMVYQFFAQELGLRGAAKEVYAIIYGRYVSFDGVAKVSLREMMRLTGLTKQSIINAPTLDKLNLAAKWLSSSQKFGLVLYGNVGSGKTMLLNSLTQLFFRTGCFMPHTISTTAAELQRYYVQDQSAEGFYGVAKNSKILLLDDLGCEPENCIIYGTSYHPISEIIYHRYRNQLTTILTTNLTDSELASRYGPRIMDRLEESFDFIAYTNLSYRKR